ncbi:MAG: hypothetical protein ACRDKV_03390 [Solirubrobacterales bacterium]
MRRPLIWVLGVAVATCGVWTGGLASAAPNVQTISGSFLPKKLPKRKRAPISLFSNLEATNPGNPFSLPNPTTLAKVDYDKDGRFQQKGLPRCNPARFGPATTTEKAKNECSDALVGSGSSIIKVPTGPATPPMTVNAEVTAFNGANKTLVLHTYNSLSGGLALVGTIRPADKAAGRQYGITLTVPVPPLAGGTAVITQLDAKVRKVYRHRGKKRSLISARCRGDRKLRAQARFTDDQGQLSTDTFVQRCKTKK